MAVTEFGKAVRSARRETKDTLLTMSKALNKSVAFLSAIETGRTKIPLDFISLVINYFNVKGYYFKEDLNTLAYVDNKSVEIDGLSYQHQMLVAGFANSRYTQEELAKISSLLKNINQLKKASSDDKRGKAPS